MSDNVARLAFTTSIGALLLSVSGPARAAGPDALSTPHGTYVWVDPDVSATPAPMAAGQPHILFLNRCAGGLTLSAGWPDDNTVNRSGILNGTTNFPEFGYGESAWQQVMEETRAIFSPFNITVTDVDPSPMPHDEAVVCGSGGTAGFSGAGGVSPFTCDVIDKPITFTFPDSLGGDPRTIAEVIAQEAAHAWGLEHEYKCEDPMTYLSGCGEKNYQDGDYPCGEYSPTSCSCGGATQNSYQYIMSLFGSAVDDLAPPTAVVTEPADGEAFAVGESFEVAVQVSDDVGVTYLGLYLDGGLATEALVEPFGPWPVLNLPEGPHEFYVEVRDGAGNSTTSAVVTIDVTVDGAPPPSGDDAAGDDSGGAAGGTGGGDGLDDGAGGGAGEEGGGGGFGGGGALPPGYGSDLGEGCACAASSGSRFGGLLFVPLLFGLGCFACRFGRSSRASPPMRRVAR